MRPVLVLLPAVLAAFCLARPGAGAAPAPAAAALEQTDVQFKELLKKAIASGKKGDVETLVRGDSAQASAWIVRISEVLLEREDPEERALLTALAEGWDGAMKTAFPAKVQEYLGALDATQRGVRVDLKKRLVRAYNDLERNRDSRDALMFVQLLDELEVLAGAFETERDLYSASEAWLAMAECYDVPLRGSDAEPHRAWKAWTKAAELRAGFECKDDLYDAAVKRAGELAKEGHDKPGGGGKDGEGKGAAPDDPGRAPGEAGNPIQVPLAFEALSAPDQFARPNFAADEVYALWQPLALGAKGSSIAFDRLGGDSPVLHRVGSSDLRFDADGDGKFDEAHDQKVVLTGTMHPFQVQIGKGERERPWAFFAITGIDQDFFQGIQVNLQPNDNVMTIYTLSAASVTGVIDGVPVRIIDDTMDGLYGSEVLTYGYTGLTNGTFQPDMDTIVIGASKRARPWSEFVQVGPRWWRLEKASLGRQVLATPAEVDTGTLKLEFKGPVAPTWLVVRGTERTKDCYYDLVEGGSKGVQVPVGRYQLLYGEVRKGKKRQVEKAVILPGRTTPNYDVRKGGTTVVTLGAPFGFDFTVQADEEHVKVVGESVCVTGSAGERYERLWNCVARPEMSWRKKGTKKGSKAEKMSVINDTQGIYDRGDQGWLAVWFPLDHEMDAKGAGGQVEVQLVDKKHDLFGKVESDWKE